jgi:hypothetical protein
MNEINLEKVDKTDSQIKGESMSKQRKVTLAGRKRISELSNMNQYQSDTDLMSITYQQKQQTLLKLKNEHEFHEQVDDVLVESECDQLQVDKENNANFDHENHLTESLNIIDYLEGLYLEWSKPKDRNRYVLSPQKRIENLKKEIVTHINDQAERLLNDEFEAPEIQSQCQEMLDYIVEALKERDIPIRNLYLIKRQVD